MLLITLHWILHYTTGIDAATDGECSASREGSTVDDAKDDCGHTDSNTQCKATEMEPASTSCAGAIEDPDAAHMTSGNIAQSIVIADTEGHSMTASITAVGAQGELAGAVLEQQLVAPTLSAECKSNSEHNPATSDDFNSKSDSHEAVSGHAGVGAADDADSTLVSGAEDMPLELRHSAADTDSAGESTSAETASAGEEAMGEPKGDSPYS
jgi:hypothetical protein